MCFVLIRKSLNLCATQPRPCWPTGVAGGHTNPGQAGAGQKQSSVDVDADVDVEASAIPLMHLCLAHIEKHLKLARNQGVDEVDIVCENMKFIKTVSRRGR